MTYKSTDTIARLPYHAFNSPSPVGAGELLHENRLHNIPAPSDYSQHHPMLLGTEFRTWDGRVFRYVQMTGADAALGTVLQAAAVVAVDTVSSASDLLSITEASAGWTAMAYAGDYVYVDESGAAAEEGQCRRIVANTTDTLYLDRPLTTALDVADSDITIIRPWHVRKALAAITSPVCGVASILNPAQGVTAGTYAIDQNYYGWMQVYGFCEHILLDDTASIAGGYLVADDGTAGTARDVGTGAAIPDQFIFGVAHVANVSNTIPGTLFGCASG